MVRLHDISKSFGTRALLRDFSLEIAPGERFVLLGRSGCGKTTLLRLIAGFETPDAGRLFIEDRDVLHLPVERRPVGFIFQRHALFPHMNVYDNIAVGPRIRGTAESEIERRIGELMDITRLKGLERAWPNQLSGGESQRVALARALINRPKILLLDEPLSALDAGLRQDLREELADIQRAFGITCLFVTHDREEAMALADRICILEDGCIQQVGTPEALYRRPGNPFVAAFLGEVNRLEGVVERVSGAEVTLDIPGAGRLACRTETGAGAASIVRTGDRVICMLRPEQLTLEKAGAVDGAGLAGTVTARQYFGSRSRYRVRLANGQTLHAQTPHADPALSPQDAVRIRAREAMLFPSTSKGTQS